MDYGTLEWPTSEGQAEAGRRDVGCHQGVDHQLDEDHQLDVGCPQDVARRPGVGYRQGAARRLGEVLQRCGVKWAREEARVGVCESVQRLVCMPIRRCLCAAESLVAMRAHTLHLVKQQVTRQQLTQRCQRQHQRPAPSLGS